MEIRAFSGLLIVAGLVAAFQCRANGETNAYPNGDARPNIVERDTNGDPHPYAYTHPEQQHRPRHRPLLLVTRF
jgi:hypothetical protein